MRHTARTRADLEIIKAADIDTACAIVLAADAPSAPARAGDDTDTAQAKVTT